MEKIFKLNTQVSERTLQEFIILVSKLNAFEFLGVLKILNVPTLADDIEITPETDPKDLKTREFEDLLLDAINTFEKLPRRSRRDIIKLLRKVHKSKPLATDTKESPHGPTA